MWAAEQGLVTLEQAERLWSALAQRVADNGAPRTSPSSGSVEHREATPIRARFDLVHVAWYGGSLLVMGALGWFATLGFDRWGGPGILVIASLYAALFGLTGVKLWSRAELKTLGGLLVAVAVSIVPLAMFGLERTLGLWPDVDPGAYGGFRDWVKGGWFGVELAGVGAGVLAVRRVPFSFVLLPVSIMLWFMSMDLTPLIFDSVETRTRAGVSAVMGVLILGAAAVMRRRGAAHLTYWLEVAGVVALEGGLMKMHSGSVWTKPVFLSIQLALLLVGTRVHRGIFFIAGTIGVLSVCGWAVVTSSSHRVLACVLIGFPLLAFATFMQHRRHIPGCTYAAALAYLSGAGVLSIGTYRSWDDDVGLMALYAMMSLGFVFAGVFLRTRLFTGVGGMAVTAWLLWLSHRVFHDSMVFPLVLVSIGIGVVVLGALVKRQSASIDAWIEAHVPGPLRALRPP